MKSHRFSVTELVVEAAEECKGGDINQRKLFFQLWTLPTMSVAPAAAITVKTSEGKLSWSWVSIKLPAHEPTCAHVKKEACR